MFDKFFKTCKKIWRIAIINQRIGRCGYSTDFAEIVSQVALRYEGVYNLMEMWEQARKERDEPEMERTMEDIVHWVADIVVYEGLYEDGEKRVYRGIFDN